VQRQEEQQAEVDCLVVGQLLLVAHYSGPALLPQGAPSLAGHLRRTLAVSLVQRLRARLAKSAPQVVEQEWQTFLVAAVVVQQPQVCSVVHQRVAECSVVQQAQVHQRAAECSVVHQPQPLEGPFLATLLRRPVVECSVLLPLQRLPAASSLAQQPAQHQAVVVQARVALAFLGRHKLPRLLAVCLAHLLQVPARHLQCNP